MDQKTTIKGKKQNRHFLIDKIYKSIYANDSCDNLEEFLSLDEQLAFEFFDVLGESNG